MMGSARSSAVNLRRPDGMALVVALLATVVMSALVAGLVLGTSTEVRIAANFSSAGAAGYAAESVVERAVQDLSSIADWNPVLNGPILSAFADGTASGIRVLDDNSTIDLAQVVNMANCEKPAGCTPADMSAVTDERPWGGANPRWRLFAFGPLRAMQPAGAIESPFYVVAMVGDDPAENDGDPSRDGIDAAVNPGAGVVAVRGEAFGPGAAHAIVEITVARIADPAGGPLPGLRQLTWRANP
jgi:type IV pilus assembly PilX-like protein